MWKSLAIEQSSKPHHRAAVWLRENDLIAKKCKEIVEMVSWKLKLIILPFLLFFFCLLWYKFQQILNDSAWLSIFF